MSQEGWVDVGGARLRMSLEEPEQFNSRVLEFIRDVEARG
jgi:hypothetical protein